MRDPQSKPTIIDEDGEHVVKETPSGTGGRGSVPFGTPGFAGGIPPIPEHLLNKNGKPSLFKMVGWKGAVVMALVVAGVIALAALSFMVLLFAIPIIAVIAIVGWVVGKVRGPQHTAPTMGRSVVVVRRRV